MAREAAIRSGSSARTPAARIFEQHRAALKGLAYRMLGDIGGAEDAVQDTYLRWHAADHDAIEQPRAWLLTTCARLCIDELRSARARRESYVGPWLPEPLMGAESPADPVERTQSLSLAFLLLLQELAPAERAAYVLHEVLDVGYGEIAPLLGKSAAACRQIVSRAGRRLRSAALPAQPRPEATAAFADALARHDRDGLMKLLAGDALLMSDGGGKVIAARNPIHGADRVARFLLGVSRKIGPALELRPVAINGGPGLLLAIGERIIAAMAFGVRRRRIAALYMVRNPDKLPKASTRAAQSK